MTYARLKKLISRGAYNKEDIMMMRLCGICMRDFILKRLSGLIISE